MTSLTPEKKERKKAKFPGKGNWWEWEAARTLSTWLTDGQDKTQLIRSVQSGGHLLLRTTAMHQVGDLAPNGPKGEEFRSHFGVECKAYATEPDWWCAIRAKNWIVVTWWEKIVKECAQFQLEPLLIMRRNGKPPVVMVREQLCEAVAEAAFIIPSMEVAVMTLTQFTAFPAASWYKAIEIVKSNPFDRRRHITIMCE